MIARQVHLARRFIAPQQIHVPSPIRCGPLRNRKPFLSRSNRRGQILAQLLPPEFLRQRVPTVHRPRHSNRVYSVLRHLPNPLLAQKLNRQPARRPPASIQPIKLVRLSVVHNRKQISADPIHHRLNHAHHRVSSNRRIHRIPAALQHPHPSLRRQRRFRSHNPPTRNHHRPPLRPILRKTPCRTNSR